MVAANNTTFVNLPEDRALTRAPALTSALDRDRRALSALLARAGVELDGRRPFDIRIVDPRACGAMLSGSKGFGESYMAGAWDCDALDALAEKLFAADLTADRPTFDVMARALLARLMNRQSKERAFEVAEAHYDLETAIFERMLDDKLVYTCGYWKDATGLSSAQSAKLDLVCRKLALAPGMRLLDIGCGFGALMKHAAEHYGVTCVGYSVSREQTRIARERCAGLPVEVVIDDYRAIRGSFDRVASIGMLEAVGYRNYRPFMEVVARVLAPDGIALVHTVGSNVSTRRGDPWIDKHIFPNGMLPSIAQMGRAIEGLLVMEDWHNFGPDYDRTLMAWNDRFQAAWPELSRVTRRGERFKRMWELYLLFFAGGFRARTYQLWQIVLTKPGRSQPSCRAI